MLKFFCVYFGALTVLCGAQIQNPTFERVTKHLEPGGEVFAVVEPQALVQEISEFFDVIQAGGTSGEASAGVFKWFQDLPKAIGLENLAAFGCSSRLMETDVYSQRLILAGSERGDGTLLWDSVLKSHSVQGIIEQAPKSTLFLAAGAFNWPKVANWLDAQNDGLASQLIEPGKPAPIWRTPLRTFTSQARSLRGPVAILVTGENDGGLLNLGALDVAVYAETGRHDLFDWLKLANSDTKTEFVEGGELIEPSNWQFMNKKPCAFLKRGTLVMATSRALAIQMATEKGRLDESEPFAELYPDSVLEPNGVVYISDKLHALVEQLAGLAGQDLMASGQVMAKNPAMCRVMKYDGVDLTIYGRARQSMVGSFLKMGMTAMFVPMVANVISQLNPEPTRGGNAVMTQDEQRVWGNDDDWQEVDQMPTEEQADASVSVDCATYQRQLRRAAKVYYKTLKRLPANPQALIDAGLIKGLNACAESGDLRFGTVNGKFKIYCRKHH